MTIRRSCRALRARGVVGLLLALAGATAACQPWYRDNARRADAAHDERRSERELDRATSAHARGDHAEAARVLRALIERNPQAEARAWVLLGLAEVAVGRAVEGRAYVRWRLSRLGPDEPDALTLRSFLIGSLVDAGLIAHALDLVQPQELTAALAYPSLAAALRTLGAAVNDAETDPAAALAALVAWLDSYGVPDHPLLEAARATVAEAVWRAAGAADAPEELAVVRQLGSLALDESMAGRAGAALALYARAAMVLPDHEFRPLADEMAAAAVRGHPADLDPAAYAHAQAGDAAWHAGRLGEALRAYRRALASAPWWAAARRNLAVLMTLADHAAGVAAAP